MPASELTGLMSFGSSLSSNVDVDNNGYNGKLEMLYLFSWLHAILLGMINAFIMFPLRKSCNAHIRYNMYLIEANTCHHDMVAEV